VKTLASAVSLFLFVFVVASCGQSNKLASYAPADLLAQAELDMEAGPTDPARYVAANKKLETYLASNPTDISARSLYAASFAAQAGVTLVGIITKMVSGAVGGGGGGGSEDPMSLLETFVGDATEANVALLKNASENMVAIDIATQTSSMKYQTGIFQSMYGVLLTKKLKDDFTNIGTIDINNAQALLDALLASKDLLKDGATAPLSQEIDSVLTKIQTDNGGTLDAAAIDAWIRASQTPPSP
jgi:hypothetical protein